MIPREFDAISKADIEALVANAVAEGRSIEYKEILPGGSDEDKREFLADVSSLANAGGGDIIYGVVEKRDTEGKSTGIPEKAEGLPNLNSDAEIRRLDESIRSGLDPRVPGIRIRQVEGFSSGPMLLVRIPKSWTSPHMVVFKNLSRFFSRTSTGKFQLDVREIRSAFSASGDLRSKISAFHTERLGKIIANEGPVVLPEAPKVILHLIPLTFLDTESQIEITELYGKTTKLPPLNSHGHQCRFNLDGFLTYTQFKRDEPIHEYFQLFRSGVFESVAPLFLYPKDHADNPLLPSVEVERIVLQGLRAYMAAAKELGITTPMLVLLTFHGVKGFGLATSSPWTASYNTFPIDRNTLILPDVLLEDFSIPPDVLIKPAFDALWQSAGFAECDDYNKQGRWEGGQSKLPGAR